MEIAIISDIHDHVENLNKAIEKIKAKKIEQVIVCGDLCSPFIIKILGEARINFHLVFGNNDGDRYQIQKIAQNFPNIIIHGEYIGDEDNILQFDGLNFGVTHYPFYAKTMVKTGWYDAVFFGHSHKYHKQKYGKSLFMNPGEIAGIFEDPGFVIYDTEYQSSERVFLSTGD